MADYSGVVVSGSSLVISAGELAEDFLVNHGGMMYVSGGVASGTRVQIGGIEFTDSGGVSYDAVVSGRFDLAEWIGSSAQQKVYIGGSAYNTTVYERGYQHVYYGGAAYNTKLNGFSFQTVYNGGVAYNTVASGYSKPYGSLTYGYHGSLTVSSGGAASGALMLYYGRMTVYAGGRAVDTVVSSGGVISALGTVNRTIVNSDGYLCVNNGGRDEHSLINSGGTLCTNSNGCSEDAVIFGWHYVSGGRARRTTISGGWQYVSSGAVAENTAVISGGQYVTTGGTADSTILYAGTSQSVYNSGLAFNTVVSGLNARQWVSSGGYAWNTTVAIGRIYVYSGGIGADIRIEAGATGFFGPESILEGYLQLAGMAEINTEVDVSNLDLSIEIGAMDRAYYVYNMNNIKTARSYTVKSESFLEFGRYTLSGICTSFDRSFTVIDGGITLGSVSIGSRLDAAEASYMLELSGGRLALLKTIKQKPVMLYSRGVAIDGYDFISGASIASGGNLETMSVYSGGSAARTSVINAGMVEVHGGEISGTTLGGGTINVYGGIAIDTVIGSGTLTVASNGRAEAVSATNGGKIMVSSGGSVCNLLVTDGGSAVLGYGGIMSAVSIANGGKISAANGIISDLAILSGGYANILYGTVSRISVASGGSININSATVSGTLDLAGTLTGGSGANFSTGEVVFRVDKRQAVDSAFCDAYMLSNLYNYTVTVDVNQAVGSYTLLNNFYRKDLNITLRNTTGEALGFLSLTHTTNVMAGGRFYELSVNSQTIFLSIATEPPLSLYKNNVLIAQSIRQSGIIISEETAVDRLVASSGGTVYGAFIDAGGTLSACSGATFDNSVVSSGGTVYICGGSASAMQVEYAGKAYIENNGYAARLIIYSGGKARVEHATVNGATVYGKGELVIASEGVLTGEVKSSGNITIAFNGSAAAAVISYAGMLAVEADGVISDSVVSSCAGMYISCDGMVKNTSISGGTMTVYSGGIARDITAKGATIYLHTGAIVQGTFSLNNNDLQCGFGVNFSAADIVINLNVPSSSQIAVADWSTLSNARSYTVRSESRLYSGIYTLSSTGGYDMLESITVIDQGVTVGEVSIGNQLVSGRDTYILFRNASGGLALLKDRNPLAVRIFDSYGNMIYDADEISSSNFPSSSAFRTDIYFGGIASATTLTGYYSYYQNIYSGGRAIATVISSGTQKVFSGGSALNTVLIASSYRAATQYVSAGGVASGTVMIGNSATQWVENGGIASGTVLHEQSSQIVNSGGLAEKSEVGNGTQRVFGTARFTTIGSGGVQYVASNATAEDTVISSGGKFNLAGGASAARVTLETGAILGYDFNANINGTSGGSALVLETSRSCDFDILSATTNVVSQNYISLRARICSGGSMIVMSGGIASGTTLSGGGLTVSSGGAIFDTIASTGSLRIGIMSGGSARNTLISGGGYDYYTIVLSVAQGAVIYDTMLGRGSTTISGHAVGTIISGGSMFIYSGGTAEDTALRSGYCTINYGGLMRDTTMSAGGSIYIWGTAERVTMSGGSMLIYSNGVVRNAELYSGGMTLGATGGSAYDTVLHSGSYQTVSSNTNCFNTKIVGGSQLIYSFGIASGTVATGGGVQQIFSGGSSVDAVIGSGGFQRITAEGWAEDTTIGNGGIQYVSSGGIANGTVVGSGGSQFIAAGGSAIGIVIESGAQSVNNGMISGTVIVRGTLETGSGAAVYNTIVMLDLAGRGSGDGVMLKGADSIAETASVSVTAAGPGIFQLVSGGSTLWTGAAGIAIYRGSELLEALNKERRTVTAGELTYTLKEDNTDGVSGNLSLNVFGRYKTFLGTISGGNAELKLENSTVSQLIAGAAQNVSGNVSGVLKLVGTNTCNVYGGGNNASIGGEIRLSLQSGTYTGLVYGGSRADGRNISTGGIALSVSGIAQSNNVKLLKSGPSAWLVGGGGAFGGGGIAVGAVRVDISGVTGMYVVGGAQAQGDGSTAAVESTAITISNALISGDVFGGGYAYDSGISIVSGDTAISFDTSSAMVTIQGSIYGGGANPSHPSKGGSSVVEGGSTITFTGYAEYISVGTVSGDGKVEGSVKGTKTLSFVDFTGDFIANLKNFDVVGFSGDTVMSYGGGFTAQVFEFDLSGREAPEYFADGFAFGEGEKLLKIELADTIGSFDLMTCDDAGSLDGLQIELYKNGVLYAGFAFGESDKGYEVTLDKGMLSLIG